MQNGESSRDLLGGTAPIRAPPPPPPSPPPRARFKTSITLLPVTFSQLDPYLGVGWGKKVCTLISYLKTDGLNCFTVKYLAGWYLE